MKYGDIGSRKGVRDLKRRLDLAETRLAQNDGRFECITGQLRDVQLYLHARFGDMDGRFDKVDARLNGLDARFDNVDARIERLDTKADALPRAIAELLANRS